MRVDMASTKFLSQFDNAAPHEQDALESGEAQGGCVEGVALDGAAHAAAPEPPPIDVNMYLVAKLVTVYINDCPGTYRPRRRPDCPSPLHPVLALRQTTKAASQAVDEFAVLPAIGHVASFIACWRQGVFPWATPLHVATHLDIVYMPGWGSKSFSYNIPCARHGLTLLGLHQDLGLGPNHYIVIQSRREDPLRPDEDLARLPWNTRVEICTRSGRGGARDQSPERSPRGGIGITSPDSQRTHHDSEQESGASEQVPAASMRQVPTYIANASMQQLPAPGSGAAASRADVEARNEELDLIDLRTLASEAARAIAEVGGESSSAIGQGDSRPAHSSSPLPAASPGGDQSPHNGDQDNHAPQEDQSPHDDEETSVPPLGPLQYTLPGVEARRSDIEAAGDGLFATREFARGEVVTYMQHQTTVSVEQWNALRARSPSIPHDMAFWWYQNPGGRTPIGFTEQPLVDAPPAPGEACPSFPWYKANFAPREGRRMCGDLTTNIAGQTANLEPKVLNIDGKPDQRRLVWVAKDAVSAGSELVFDYGEGCEEWTVSWTAGTSLAGPRRNAPSPDSRQASAIADHNNGYVEPGVPADVAQRHREWHAEGGLYVQQHTSGAIPGDGDIAASIAVDEGQDGMGQPLVNDSGGMASGAAALVLQSDNSERGGGEPAASELGSTSGGGAATPLPLSRLIPSEPRNKGELPLYSPGMTVHKYAEQPSPERLFHRGGYQQLQTVLVLPNVARLRAMEFCNPPTVGGRVNPSKWTLSYMRSLVEDVGTLTVKTIESAQHGWNALLEWEDDLDQQFYCVALKEFSADGTYQVEHEWYFARGAEHVSVFVARDGQEYSQAFSLLDLRDDCSTETAAACEQRVAQLKSALANALAPAVGSDGTSASSDPPCPIFGGEGAELAARQQWDILAPLVRARAAPSQLVVSQTDKLASRREARRAKAVEARSSDTESNALPPTQSEAVELHIREGDECSTRVEARLRLLALAERDGHRLRFNGSIHQDRQTKEYFWDLKGEAANGMQTIARARYESDIVDVICADKCLYHVRWRKAAGSQTFRCSVADTEHTCSPPDVLVRKARMAHHAYSAQELAVVVRQFAVDAKDWKQVGEAIRPYLRAEPSEGFCRRVGKRL